MSLLLSWENCCKGPEAYSGFYINEAFPHLMKAKKDWGFLINKILKTREEISFHVDPHSEEQ